MGLVEDVLLLADGGVQTQELIRLLPVPLQGFLLLLGGLEPVELELNEGNTCIYIRYTTVRYNIKLTISSAQVRGRTTLKLSKHMCPPRPRINSTINQ